MKSFITLSLLATRLCMKMEGKAVDPNEIAGLGFISLNIVGMVVTIVLLERYSEQTLNSGRLSKGMAGSLWFVFGYSMSLLGYFVLTFKKLVEALYLQESARAAGRRSQRDAGGPRAERNQIHTQYFLERLHPAVAAQSRLDLFKRKRPVAVLDHPKFLARMASSLFKVAPEPPVAGLTAHKKSSILRRDPRSTHATAKKPDIKTGSLLEQQQAQTAPKSHKKTVSEYLQVRNSQPSRSSDNLSQSVVIDSEIGEFHRNAFAAIEKRPAGEQPEADKENHNDSNVSKSQQQQHQSLQPGLGESQHSR